MQDNLTQGANLGAGFAKWSPDSGETVRERLAAIVGGAMGYEPEDLPWEVPLIELGLDSLMAVRIKNRVEYDFDLPPIQTAAVRDANLYAVEKLIEYAIEHRDEVEQLHEHQKTQDREEIAAEQAALMAGTAPTVTTEQEEQATVPSSRHPPPPTVSGRACLRPMSRQPLRPAHQPGGPGSSRRRSPARPGAQPAGRRRGAGRRRAAARSRRAGPVRDLGHRHRQVAGRHLQCAANA